MLKREIAVFETQRRDLVVLVRDALAQIID
jgi:hypothetical protein